MVLCVQPVNFLAGDKKPPAADDQKILRNSIMELCESKISTHAIKAGSRAPDFTLINTQGDELHSLDLIRKGPMIIVFLRGLWCWYSHATLMTLETINKAITNKGASIVAISPQIHFSHADVNKKKLVSFPVLRDVHSRVALEFKVAWRLPSPLRKKYLTLGADLDKFNGPDNELLPMASLFVIDKQATITYSEVNANYTQPMNENELFILLDNMPPLRKARSME